MEETDEIILKKIDEILLNDSEYVKLNKEIIQLELETKNKMNDVMQKNFFRYEELVMRQIAISNLLIYKNICT